MRSYSIGIRSRERVAGGWEKEAQDVTIGIHWITVSVPRLQPLGDCSLAEARRWSLELGHQ